MTVRSSTIMISESASGDVPMRQSRLRALVGAMHGSSVDLLNLVGVNSYFPRTWYSWSAELTDLPD
jgi:hypothetical protein